MPVIFFLPSDSGHLFSVTSSGANRLRPAHRVWQCWPAAVYYVSAWPYYGTTYVCIIGEKRATVELRGLYVVDICLFIIKAVALLSSTRNMVIKFAVDRLRRLPARDDNSDICGTANARSDVAR